MGGLPALISETFVAVELPGGADVLEVAIGLDAGGTSIRVGLVDVQGLGRVDGDELEVGEVPPALG